MTGIVVSRPPRQPGPQAPSGTIELQEPPTLPEVQSSDASAMLTYLPMGLGSGATVLMFAGPGSPTTYLASGLMVASTVGMMFGQVGRSAGERKRRLRAERRDYLRYLAQIRRQARRAVQQQREAVAWLRPDPALLPQIATGPRVWERRPGHDDFAEVRVGLGERRAALRLAAPQTKPVEDLEPLCATALRRLIRAYSAVTDIPSALHLRGFAEVAMRGDPAAARATGRAVLAQLATFHAPADLRVAMLIDPQRLPDWQWARWLPHNGHPTDADAAGPLRLFSAEHDRLLGLLGTRLLDRPAFTAGAAPSAGEPYLVVLCDGAAVPERSPLRGGLRNAVLLSIDPGRPVTHPYLLDLVVERDRVQIVAPDAPPVAVGRPDLLGPADCEQLARTLAPLRTTGAVGAAEPLEADLDLARLLGIGDARTYDPWPLWRAAGRGNLRVPIGVGADGQVVELDLKESAQGGVGPHGMVIGATGSGKSELLRTLVIALAATHSPEALNVVLADFKGGATFLGMERLPHTSAVITNLADELSLVDRMQDALHGELIRRQKLLREAGFSSRLDYEKARLGGMPLESLPTLLIVVDEFSELLSTKPQFTELFVMIGRLGRSLGVHLLLASQRLDEGRLHQLESHLSYRIGLRTFSAGESRAVIGVPDAYELPAVPGHGYLKVDTTTLVRFRASYVSGPYTNEADAAVTSPGTPASRVVLFGLDPVPDVTGRAATSAGPAPAAATGPRESLIDVLVGRMSGQGPLARQVWLPPLGDPPGLDLLLPGLVPDPRRGLIAANWPGTERLQVPVGVVDRPFDQIRDLLILDLGGAAGNAAVVGAPQSGKSNLLRTMILTLALTHTPVQVQFYCLDFGGGALASLSGLPHVGSVAARMDRDRVKRTIAELAALLSDRENAFAARGVESMAQYRQLRSDDPGDDPFGDVFLVVDGWYTVRQDFEDLEASIAELATRGLNYGIHVVIAAGRWSEIRSSLRDMFGTRLELRLGDPLESEVGSRAAAGVPAVPGRGLTPQGLHFLAALPSAPDAADPGHAVRTLVEDVEAAWPGVRAPAVRLLPAELTLASLPAPHGDLSVALGWDENRLEPVWHDFAVTPHLLVFGDDESGKTNLLRLVARAIMHRYHPDEAKILLADARVGLYHEVDERYRTGYAGTADTLAELAAGAAVSMRRRLPGPEITPERLRRRDWWTGPRLFILIDDHDLFGSGLGGPLEPLIGLLPQAAGIGMHLVVTRTTSGGARAMMDPLLRRMWELGSPGLLLSCVREEGTFLGEARPLRLPPGRAQLVTRRAVRLVQTGLVPPETRPKEAP
ncbi:type VII secretion protein EccCa [Krasilnikovia sp. M28-CT-15]|uniref:type VII secretion protein EccCa n=1 Tax=Krasilnikovia sp. M28-CT-15 TaxID=3373540 RepID=UPI0038766BDB